VLQYTIRRLFLFIPVIIGVLLVVFATLRLVPGDPAAVFLGVEGSAEDRARVAGLLGLDQPLPAQFLQYVLNTGQGNLGRSIFLGSDVSRLLLDALPATIELAVLALVIALLIAIPIGILAAVRANSPVDVAVTVGALIGVSMPLFWFAILAILLFSLRLGWLPSFGRGPGLIPAVGGLFSGGPVADLPEALRYAALPALTLALGPVATIARLTRTAMLEVLRLDYVRTARAKGLTDRAVVYRHAFRNALLPIVTIVGLQFGALLGGAVITETIFAWPGIGRLVVTAIGQRDYPLVQGSVVLIAVLVSVVNLMVDLSYAFINPKIRYG
jgi:ABC-type dipeptide/oligopeptide/nickel transport system permease component